MKPKPIIFNTEMVRAILDGRKTQTRRVIKPQPDGITVDGIAYRHKPVELCRGTKLITVNHDDGQPIVERMKPPYRPGQILWVRETWAEYVPGCLPPRGFSYRADHDDPKGDGPANPMKWRPSIHMPREAARLFLLVNADRIERLQEITPEDIAAEGLPSYIIAPGHEHYGNVCGKNWLGFSWYEKYWDKLNARRGYPWDSNPWVEVITFERTEVAP